MSLFGYFRGHRLLQATRPSVTVFGSARFQEGHPAYALGLQLGEHCAKAGYTVVTGGGPGLMEAAARGAKQAQGRTIGFNIDLPREQKPNLYLDHALTFSRFSVRKALLLFEPDACFVLPGGIGTLDELFEALTLVVTGKLRKCPVILINSVYWRPLLQWIQNTVIHERALESSEIDFLHLVDTAEEALTFLKKKC